MDTVAVVFYVHWDEGEAGGHADALRALGHRVAVHALVDATPILPDPTDVVAISLERLPSHGRAIAEWVQGGKRRRAIPIVFVGGAADKVARVRERFTDAAYCDRDQMSAVIARLTGPPLHRPRAPRPQHH
jgi:hypothetical protein